MSITRNILEAPFDNPFDDSRYSHEDYSQFGSETEGRLTANLALSGITQVQLDNYSDALRDYITMLGTEASAKGNQKGSTEAIKVAWDAFVKEVRRKEGLVNSTYGKGSSGYLKIFPQGLSPYSNTAKGNQMTLINHLETQFTAMAADFPGVAASFTTLKAAYLSASNTQNTQKGAVSGSKSGRDLARLNLANNHHEIWLTMAIANMGKPDVVKVIYNAATFDKGTNYDNDGKGRMRVLLTDFSLQPLINATVIIRNQEGQIKDQGTTNDDGYYESSDLAIGFYDVEMGQTGFVNRVMQWQVFDNKDPLHEEKLSIL